MGWNEVVMNGERERNRDINPSEEKKKGEVRKREKRRTQLVGQRHVDSMDETAAVGAKG